MQSQFGESSGSLQATLVELVDLAKYMAENPEKIREKLLLLEGISKMLDYFTIPRENVDFIEFPLIPDVRCQQCNKSWHEPDACILNFAGVWLCRAHHPELKEGSIRPPGWYEPVVESEKRDKARSEALKLLNREQLRLVNGRIGG